MSFEALGAAELDYQVRRLLAAYVHCIDSDALEQWPSFFTDQCAYRIVARENADRGLDLPTMLCDSRGMLTDRVVSMRKANIYERHGYRHMLSATLLDGITADTVTARTNYSVFRTRTNGVSELYSTGLYTDLIVREDGDLRFKAKTVTFDTNRIDSLMVTPL